MAKPGELEVDRSHLWLGLQKLTQKEGVHRKDLAALLVSNLSSLATHWGINVRGGGARGELASMLHERIAKIRPIHPAHREKSPAEHVAQFRFIAAVGFNVERKFNFSSWNLTRRQVWIADLRDKEYVKGYEKIWNYAVSQSTAHRDLKDAITQLEQIILAEGYIEQVESTPPVEDVPDDPASTEVAEGRVKAPKESSATVESAVQDVEPDEELSVPGEESIEAAVELPPPAEAEFATEEKRVPGKSVCRITGDLFKDSLEVGEADRASEITPASLGYAKNLTPEDISFDVKLPPFEDYFTAFDVDSSLDDLMLKAQTFASRREAQAGMAQRFDLDNESHNAYHDPRATAEQVMHGIHCARESGGFSVKQQRKAAISLAGLPTGYRGLIDLHRTVYGIAGKDLAEASKLLSEIGKAARRVRRYDLAVEHKTHMFLYSEICDQGDLHPAPAQRGYVEVIRNLEPWRFVGAPLYCVINLVNALSIELLRLNHIVETSWNSEEERSAREESGRLAALTERILAFSAGAPAAVTSVLRDELVEITGEVRAIIKARVLEPWLTDVIVHDDGQGNVIFMPNPSYDDATRRGYLEQVRLHRMRANLGSGDLNVELDD